MCTGKDAATPQAALCYSTPIRQWDETPGGPLALAMSEPRFSTHGSPYSQPKSAREELELTYQTQQLSISVEPNETRDWAI